MPDIGNDGLDVSAEEQRYLRRAFRRFALPYLLLTVAIVGGAASMVMLRAPAVPEAPPVELEGLIAEAASLREAVATARGEFREQASRASARLDALEGGMEALTADVKRVASSRRDSGRETSAELGGRLDHAHQRINALDRRLKDAIEGRFPELDKAPIATPAPALRPEPVAQPQPDSAWPPASPVRP